mmetsp:Transcript_3516/g.4459  ORF Transcript_3516/g.4459 Transcript_3516/m.4459 type:complete len:97 (-) Transcript_3516:224-514(-)
MNIDHGVIGSETSIQLVPQAPVPSSVPPPATTTAQAGPVPSRPLCTCGAGDRHKQLKNSLEAQGKATGAPAHNNDFPVKTWQLENRKRKKRSARSS